MRLRHRLFVLAAVLGVIGSTAAFTARSNTPLETWRIILTRAVPTGGHKAGEDFGESKVLTDVLNEMARQGYAHVSMHPLEEEYQGVRQYRFLIVNRR
jgi:hypothetical protein